MDKVDNVKRARICMLSTRHSVDDARIVHREAVSLVNAGYEVVLLFACNEQHEYMDFSGNVVIKGVAEDGAASRLNMNIYGCPKKKGFFSKWSFYRNMVRLALKIDAGAYHVHEPDLALLIALRVKRIFRRRGKSVFVIHDLHEYPWSSLVDSLPKLFRRFTYWLMRIWDGVVVHKIDCFFTANTHVCDYVTSLKKNARVEVLFNAPSYDNEVGKSFEPWNFACEPLVLCHEGSLTYGRGLREMVEVVDRFRGKVRLLIIGDVFGEEREWFERELEKRNLANHIFRTGWLPYDDVREVVRKAHVGLILFREDLVNFLSGPPNKLFHYMAAGIPVLSVDMPAIRSILLEEKCGVIIRDQSVKSIIEAISNILNFPDNIRKIGDAGRSAIEQKYSWKHMERKLIRAYHDMGKNMNPRFDIT